MTDYALALVHYRGEEFSRARRLLEPLCDKRSGATPAGFHYAESLLSLVYYELGEDNAAERMLSRALEAEAEWLEDLEGNALNQPWCEGLESHILCELASLRLRGESLNSSRLRQIEDSAREQWE